MNLFDVLVVEALNNKPELSSLRPVVEKELLHHDILRIMQDNGLLGGLTFIGGTCLRMCYRSNRLSEDLEFTGGSNFTRGMLADLGQLLLKALEEKYGLVVTVTAPEKDLFNVDTWKIKVITRPEKKHMPAQRINIDVCAVPSYEKVPLFVYNHYGVEIGSSGLIIAGQSREEIFADKLLAIAFRPNRVKYRDLWDIAWLHSLGVEPRIALIEPKLADRSRAREEFVGLFRARCLELQGSAEAPLQFWQEMARFLPQEQLPANSANGYWHVLLQLLGDLSDRVGLIS